MRSASRPPVTGYGDPDISEEPIYWAQYLLLRFIQGTFNHIEHYHWEPDDQTTNLIVRDTETVEQEVVAQRPAILVTRGPSRFAHLFLDDLMANHPLTGERIHSDLLSMTLTALCISRWGKEAQHIAWLTGRAIKERHRLLRKYWLLSQDDGTERAVFGFHKIGEQIDFGSETPAGSIITGAGNHTYRMVPVALPAFLQWTWKTIPRSPEYKESLGLFMEKDRAVEVEKPQFDRADQAPMTFRLEPAGAPSQLNYMTLEEFQVSGMGKGPDQTT